MSCRRTRREKIGSYCNQPSNWRWLQNRTEYHERKHTHTHTHMDTCTHTYH